MATSVLTPVQLKILRSRQRANRFLGRLPERLILSDLNSEDQCGEYLRAVMPTNMVD